MSFDARLCEGCPIQGRYRPIEQVGEPGARFLVVTDRPSQAAARERRLLTTAQSRIFADEARRLGFDRDDFRFTPACHCAYELENHTTKERSAIHKHCRQHLLAEIETGRPGVVLTLGADATSQVFGRSTKITRVRGLSQEVAGIDPPVFPLLSPGIVVKYPQNAPLFRADMDSFGRFVDADYDASRSSAMEDSTVRYQIVEDLEFLIEQNPEIVSFDTENTGLRWYQTGTDVRGYVAARHRGAPAFRPRFQILTMQFSIRPGEAYMLVWDHPEQPIPEGRKAKIRNQLRRLLCRPDVLVIGQNTKYDNVALWMTEGIRFRIGGCTQMLAALLDENQMERNLDVLTKLHVPEMAGYADRFNATVNKERMWEESLSNLLPYGCGDADAALRVYYALEAKVMEDEKLWAHYCRVSIPGLNAFAALETRGMYTDDKDALPAFKALMRQEVEEQRRALLHAIPKEVKRDVISAYCAKPGNRGALAAEEALSFTRGEFLRQVLFLHPKGFRLKPKVFTKSTANLRDEAKRVPSTSAKDHLPFFFDSCPFTRMLAEYVKDSSLLEKSVINFEKKYIVGGKVRPVYRLDRTATGRSSSEDPNGQNYPKRGPRAKAYRKMLVPPPGHFVCENDLSQAELRIAAAMSGDRTMIEIYRSGGDIHSATACIVLGVTPAQFQELDKAVKKDARQKAKAVNFGFLYGMGWRKFINYAKTQYNVEFTDAEAQRVRSAFFRKYRSLESWHANMREFAKLNKYVRSFSGRIRHLPMIDSSEDGVRSEAERQAINSPVQEFGSSLGVMALGRMNEELNPEYIQIVGFIHDALVYYVREEYLDWGMKTVKRYMQTNPLQEWFGVQLPVPIIADVGFGKSLGEIIEVGDFGEFKLDEPFDFSKVKNKETGEPLVDIPPQRIPPNEGRLLRSVYTLPEDLEDENTVTARRAPISRLYRTNISKGARSRMERSAKQMIINRRNIQKRMEQEREYRAGSRILRRK